MSRSNPTEGSKNPSRRWFEYAGGNDGGVVRYYDKEKGEQVIVGEKFQFILLDQLSTVKGWHDASDSGIYANEVRDTKQDTLVVRSFSGGVLAEGFYSDIRDRIGNLGGHYVASCYIAFKDDDGNLAIGNLGLKGASLRAWMDFQKSCPRKESSGKKVPAYYVDAVKIDGYEEGQKGKVVFRTPKFSLVPISPESQKAAVALDQELQDFLADYLKRPRTEASEIAKEAQAPSIDAIDEQRAAEFADDDILF